MNAPFDPDELDRKLGRLELPEGVYKPDLELHDRSQAFSSELLKLPLAGVAVVGFLLAYLPKGPLEKGLTLISVKLAFSGAVAAFAFAAACALLQRFHASSALFHHLQVIKLLRISDPAHEAEAKRNMAIRTARFLQAHAQLKLAAAFVVVGAVLLSGAFIRLLFPG